MPALPFAKARAPLWLAYGVCAFGIAWRLWGSSYLGARVVFDPEVRTDALCIAGPFRFTRNPLYFGLNCYAIGIALAGPPLTVAIVAAGTIAVCELLMRAEEPRLRERFGSRYDAFASRVPRLFPSLRPQLPDDGSRPSLAAGLRVETFALVLAALAFDVA